MKFSKWSKVKQIIVIVTTCSVSCFIFKENFVFNEEDNPSQKVAIVDEELDDVDKDDIGNL